MSGHIDRAAEVLGDALGSSYSPAVCRLLARHLDAADLLVTPEHDAAVAVEAWDEGFSRGFYVGASGLYGPDADASEPNVTNPYEP